MKKKNKGYKFHSRADDQDGKIGEHFNCTICNGPTRAWYLPWNVTPDTDYPQTPVNAETWKLRVARQAAVTRIPNQPRSRRVTRTLCGTLSWKHYLDHIEWSILRCKTGRTATPRKGSRAALANARFGEGLESTFAAGRGERDLVLGLLAALHLCLANGLAVLVLALRGGIFAIDVHVYQETVSP